jgi:hypothetical protein
MGISKTTDMRPGGWRLRDRCGAGACGKPGPGTGEGAAYGRVADKPPETVDGVLNSGAIGETA